MKRLVLVLLISAAAAGTAGAAGKATRLGVQNSDAAAIIVVTNIGGTVIIQTGDGAGAETASADQGEQRRPRAHALGINGNSTLHCVDGYGCYRD